MQFFTKYKHKEKRLKHSVIRFAPLILVVYLVIQAFAAFQAEDKAAVMARNRDYIKDITLAMANKLDDIFSNSLKSVEALAKLSSASLYRVFHDLFKRALGSFINKSRIEFTRSKWLLELYCL